MPATASVCTKKQFAAEKLRKKSLNEVDKLPTPVSHFTTPVPNTCHRFYAQRRTPLISPRPLDVSINVRKKQILGAKDVERRKGIDDIMSVGGKM